MTAARYSGSCGVCGKRYLVGDEIKKQEWQWVHVTCPDESPGSSQMIKPKRTRKVRPIT